MVNILAQRERERKIQGKVKTYREIKLTVRGDRDTDKDKG